jgi:hypothetical protein
MVKVSIESGSNGRVATVTPDGALAVGPVSFNLVKFNALDVINIAYNFYGPLPGKQFVVTAIFAYGDKQVAQATNATVEVYEAVSTTSAVVDKIIMQFEIGQNEFHPFTSLNLLVSAGVFINAKTDDEDVHMNILGYYVEAL